MQLRRKARVGALLVGLVALVAVAVAGPAGADVTPTGKTSLKVGLTFTLTIFNDPSSFTVTGTMTGTLAKNGTIAIPKAAILINPAKNIEFAGGQVKVPQIAFTAPGDWKGGVDPKTGLVTLAGPLVVTTTVSYPVPAPACPIGPIALNLSSAKKGGKKYDAKTGTATVTDASYSIPALNTDPPGVPGCGGVEGVFNNAMELPTAPGASTATIVLTFSPVVQGTGVATPVTQAAPTTTTTLAPSTTTAAPVQQTQLPRTGSSSTPLAIVGGALVLAGAAMVSGRRRRGAARDVA